MMAFTNKSYLDSGKILTYAAGALVAVLIGSSAVSAADTGWGTRSISAPGEAAQRALKVIQSSPLVAGGVNLGTAVLYDDPATRRAADYLELYDGQGGLVVVSWFDSFGIQRIAVDRAFVAGEERLEGVVQNNESTIPQDIVNDTLRRPYRERFGIILSRLGAGLAGRPEDIQEVLKRAHPGLRETSRVLRILGRQNSVIERFIVNSDRVIGELEGNKRDVVRWVRESADTAEISASRREDISRGFERLPTFLAELEPTMANLGDLADEQIPLLTDLQRGAPHLETFFRRLGPFSEASRPAIRSLGEASEKGTRAFGEGTEEVAELRRLARDAKPTAKPLRQFLQTMDDRRRYIEIDPRAKDGAPPEPDPTAIPGEGGFTGAEAFWNYWLWQGLSINGFDQFGHVLRIGIVTSECSEYINEGPEENPEHDEAFFDKCNSWLGPYQPGINAPDFSENRVTRSGAERPAARQGERRGQGQPDAGPLPGQPDISRPNVTLPPGIQPLVDGLGRGGRGDGSGSGTDQAAQMLDYLLAP